MTHHAARAAIEGQLTANWTTLPLFQDNNVNPASRPALGFVVVNYPSSRETMLGVGHGGNNRYREEGRAEVSVFVPIGAGDATAETYANQLRAVFRAQHFNGVRIHGVEAAANRATDGRYYVAAFALPYTFDIYG